VGERWSLLIVRELLGGPKRYTELRSELGDVSPTLLASRLAELEADGLVEQQVLPPPAGRTVYVLTDDGRTLVPILRDLTRWGMHRIAEPDVARPPRPLMVARAALFAYLEPARLGGADRTYEFRIDQQPFTIEIRDGHSQLQDGSPSAPADLVVTISAADLIRLRRGSLTVRQATKTGGMEYRAADRARVAEFVDAFALEHSP
jgi:DNA-binding HxlR family transcriptional regulator